MIAAVVLAAGASSRYGTSPPKQVVFLPRVLAALGDLPVVVVAGAHELDVDAQVVHCADWERGPGASLRCGLAALGPEVEAALVVLADGPELDPRAVRRVIDAYEGAPVAASYGGVRLHPVLLPRSAWARVPDEGARGIDARLVRCDDLREPGDVDERTGT